MPKKIPVRQCAACRQQKEKNQLARVVRTPQGEILYDPKGKLSGRGVYLCPSLSCLEKAIKSRALSRALESRFLSQGRPKDLSLMCSAGQGDGKRLGMNHFAHPGMLRRVIGGHWNWAPKLGEMAVDNQFEAYNLPQGTLVQLYGAMACGQPGVITKTGLGTFVDPRQQGHTDSQQQKAPFGRVQHSAEHGDCPPIRPVPVSPLLYLDT